MTHVTLVYRPQEFPSGCWGQKMVTMKAIAEEMMNRDIRWTVVVRTGEGDQEAGLTATEMYNVAVLADDLQSALESDHNLDLSAWLRCAMQSAGVNLQREVPNRQESIIYTDDAYWHEKLERWIEVIRPVLQPS